MSKKPTQDAQKFGEGRWVYCRSHVTVHSTGWCTVSANRKVLLKASDRESALAEARANGFPIHGENIPT